ncbi:aspartic peptidase domain-containing protein [Leucosporidium creatinivorum]|uniref:Aspartic peptidase domain-containing protein n=1 Tax=Leucosporidium creatinivorum TaxID=106004 RepID=A0A1Y2F8I1_9BASI|nr:aspartic peptidase domain-containing protein [Leucosporidium creatinivorum]
MRSAASLAATAAVLFAIGLHDATPVQAVPAAVDARSASPSPAQAAPITVPIHRRAGHAKRNKESFLRAVAHMKAKYGGPTTTASGRKAKRSTTGSLSMTNYQDSEFYATISVGTPATEYSMVLDTGSSDMILAVDSCSGCSSSTPGYSASSSSTSVASSDAFSITYGSGSASGTLVEDTVSIAGYSMPNQVFAACDTMDNIVDGDISGILGMGWSTIASSGAVPLVEALAQNGTLPSEVFGFAFKSYAYDKLTSETMAGGTLTIGSTDTSAYSGDINWIPIQLPGGYWSIPLDGMTASGSDITLTTTNIIVDTGTTLIGMPAADVTAIYDQISAASAYSLDGESGYYSFPCDTNINVTMTFGGVSYAIPSDSFNAGAIDTSGSTCLGAIFALQTSGTVQAILGDAFLTGVYSAFRFDDTPAVGFAELGSGGTAVAGSSEASKSSGSTSPASGLSNLLSRSSVGVAVLASVVGAMLW